MHDAQRDSDLDRHLRRVLRESAHCVVSRSMQRFSVHDRSEDSAALREILTPCTIGFRPSTDRMLKDGDTTTVWLREIDGRCIVIKRYNLTSAVHALRRCCRPSRAAKSWLNAHRLRFLGVPTPKPVAFMEARFGPLRGRAWFVNEYVAATDCGSFFADPCATEAERERTAGRVACLVRQLRDLRLSHGDLKASNILIHDGAPLLVDLDALRLHRSSRQLARRSAKDRRRFLRNWDTDPVLKARFDALLSGT